MRALQVITPERIGEAAHCVAFPIPLGLDAARTLRGMAITFSVTGNPVPQPRARITTRGGFAHAYTPKSHPVVAYRMAVALEAKGAGATPHGDLCEVVIDAVFARPKSHSNKSGLKADAPATPRCDVDNVGKAVLDALTGTAWHDDAQVVRLVVEKSYGTEGRTTVRIT